LCFVNHTRRCVRACVCTCVCTQLNAFLPRPPWTRGALLTLAAVPPWSPQALRAEADGKSLLLLDELGTGTDPLEGAALGVALLKKLVRGEMVRAGG
jgi:hypothetical protein